MDIDYPTEVREGVFSCAKRFPPAFLNSIIPSFDEHEKDRAVLPENLIKNKVEPLLSFDTNTIPNKTLWTNIYYFYIKFSKSS